MFSSKAARSTDSKATADVKTHSCFDVSVVLYVCWVLYLLQILVCMIKCRQKQVQIHQWQQKFCHEGFSHGRSQKVIVCSGRNSHVSCTTFAVTD